MAITIARPVVIKAIVTERFKRLYTQELQTAIARVDELVTQIDTQIRRTELERQITPQARAIRQQLELERAREWAVESVRPQGDLILLKLAGVDDLEAARALQGAAVAVPREERMPLPEGAYHVA